MTRGDREVARVMAAVPAVEESMRRAEPAFWAAVSGNAAMRRLCVKTVWHEARECMSAARMDRAAQERAFADVLVAVAPGVARRFAASLVLGGGGEGEEPHDDCGGGVVAAAERDRWADPCGCPVCLSRAAPESEPPCTGSGDPTTMHIVRCGHRFHTACACRWFCGSATAAVTCPLCRGAL